MNSSDHFIASRDITSDEWFTPVGPYSERNTVIRQQGFVQQYCSLRKSWSPRAVQLSDVNDRGTPRAVQLSNDRVTPRVEQLSDVRGTPQVSSGRNQSEDIVFCTSRHRDRTRRGILQKRLSALSEFHGVDNSFWQSPSRQGCRRARGKHSDGNMEFWIKRTTDDVLNEYMEADERKLFYIRSFAVGNFLLPFQRDGDSSIDLRGFDRNPIKGIDREVINLFSIAASRWKDSNESNHDSSHARNQIELDIPRSGVKKACEMDALRIILITYLDACPERGYTQGLNVLGAAVGKAFDWDSPLAAATLVQMVQGVDGGGKILRGGPFLPGGDGPGVGFGIAGELIDVRLAQASCVVIWEMIAASRILEQHIANLGLATSEERSLLVLRGFLTAGIGGFAWNGSSTESLHVLDAIAYIGSILQGGHRQALFHFLASTLAYHSSKFIHQNDIAALQNAAMAGQSNCCLQIIALGKGTLWPWRRVLQLEAKMQAENGLNATRRQLKAPDHRGRVVSLDCYPENFCCRNILS